MPSTDTILSGVMSTLSATTAAQGTGQVVAASVGPKPGNVDIAEILTGTIDLNWITKDVGFKDAQPIDDVHDDTTLGNAIKGGIVPVSLPNSVQGLFGQLKGTVPLLSETTVPVGIEVTWEVLDENKAPLAAGEFAVVSGQPETGSKVKGLDIVVAFKPVVDEMTASKPVPDPKKRYLRPTVKLTVLDESKEKADFPEIEVVVPAIGIPRLLAAFRHVDFKPTDGGEDGFVCLFVPADSPLQSFDHLKETLSKAQQALTAVKNLGDFAATLTGIDSITNGVTASPYFVFVRGNSIDNLNDITAIQRAWYQNDIELEDEISSMIVIGAKDKVLDVYCETGLNDENGHFTLKIGPNNFTTVHNLHSDNPNDNPDGMLDVLVAPTHSAQDDDDLTFGDWISSFQWL